jgi:NAD(P)-dependent dehydrogenase (short-subunit alcohol dehydrogenase family)
MAVRFQNKICLVTGAGSGIGKTTALKFAEEGAILALADLNPKSGAITANEINKNGGKAIFIETDVSKANEVKALVKTTVNTFGRLDIAVNNAGIGHKPSLIHDIEEEAFDRVISVDLKGVWLCLKYELPQMVNQKFGRIVNISSIGGIIAAKGLAAYSAAKGGVNQLTRVTALEYASYGIRTNAVCPAVTMTPLTEDTLRDEPEQFKEMIGSQPLGRLAQPEEIANVALWLCSEESSYVNGVCLPVDGGITVA